MLQVKPCQRVRYRKYIAGRSSAVLHGCTANTKLGAPSAHWLRSESNLAFRFDLVLVNDVSEAGFV